MISSFAIDANQRWTFQLVLLGGRTQLEGSRCPCAAPPGWNHRRILRRWPTCWWPTPAVRWIPSAARDPAP